MVLESRQACAGENASNYNETSKETRPELAAPKQMTEESHQYGLVDVDQFQQASHMTEMYETDELVVRPETKNEAIKTTSSDKERRKRNFANKSKEVSPIEEFMPKPRHKVNKQDCVDEQKKSSDGEEHGPKSLMMSRAQLYAALADKPEQDGRRINPNKGKFFFGSTLRLYGGSRWSELRKKVQDEQVKETVSTCQEFELEENCEHEFKRVRFGCEPQILEEDTKKIDEEELGKFITVVEKNKSQHEHISDIKRYQGNWKASGPAFIIITNALFMDEP